MRGPYFLDNSLILWWGREPIRRCMLPKIGSFQGPGGRFEVIFPHLNLFGKH